MLNDERIEELVHQLAEHCDDKCIAETAIRIAIAEAVAKNDEAWQWQLKNPESMACMAKAAYVRYAIKKSVAEEREILAYIYQQTLGDKLKSQFKDDDMARMFLRVGMLRRLAAIAKATGGQNDE